MTRKRYSTDAKRKALAREVSLLASEILGIPVMLERGEEGFRGEYKFRSRPFETARGPVSYLTIDVDHNGVDIHSNFGFPQFAPPGANRYSGKWNHYLWSDAETILAALPVILYDLRPIETRPRADRPTTWEAWR